jgi:transcription antitermination factor NusG
MQNLISGWYIIYTKPRHEKKVTARLSEAGINYFLPMTRSVRIWHDRKKVLDMPLFPSYVFVYLNDRNAYCKSMETEGFLYYVKTGKEIARINASVIENIKLLINCNNNLEVSGNYFPPGRKLVIIQGALTGLSCEVIESDRKKKFLVRVHLLERSLLLTMPEEHLQLM